MNTSLPNISVIVAPKSIKNLTEAAANLVDAPIFSKKKYFICANDISKINTHSVKKLTSAMCENPNAVIAILCCDLMTELEYINPAIVKIHINGNKVSKATRLEELETPTDAIFSVTDDSLILNLLNESVQKYNGVVCYNVELLREWLKNNETTTDKIEQTELANMIRSGVDVIAVR